MLTLQAISGPRDQQALLSQFDPSQTTWVVSDLKSKIDLQRHLMKERQFLHGESVLRASELWKLLLTRLRPDVQVVSKEFAVTLISQELSSRDLDWARTSGASQTAYQYLCQLMPILSHPQGSEIMGEWFEAHPASHVRWGRWFDLSMDLWRSFLEKGIVAGPWVSGVLVNELEFEQVWNRRLIFDLGAELNQVEADLIALLSVVTPVTVLQPHPTWRDEYRRTLLAYEILEKKPKAARTYFASAHDPSRTPPREYRKFTTMLAEVKQAVARARSWLDEGQALPAQIAPSQIAPSQIAIVAPDIEIYWPVLSAYLEEEGIASQKARVARVHTFPDITQWLATSRLRAGGHGEADLEVSLYQKAAAPSLSYERFRILYSAIYSREDLERDSDITLLYAMDLDSQAVVDRDTFVAWSLKALPEHADRSRVEAVFKRLFQECPEITRLSLERWLLYLEEIAARCECRVRDGDPDGVACINLVSAENAPATHMILIGLTESALRQGAETGILFADILSLAASFGFHLQSQDTAKLEFEARWITENSSRHLVLCVPETDFDGAVQAPAWLWVKGAREAGHEIEVSVPDRTRWDEMQSSSFEWLARERRWSEGRSRVLRDALEEDLGLKPLPTYAARSVRRLSASSIEDYLQCPFIFASKSLFKLSDLPSLDLDVDASTRGKLLHAIFERLTREPMQFGLDRDELAKVVDLAREQAAVQIYDERLWPSLRGRYVETALRFLEFEREWRQRFPATRVLDREVTIDGWLDPETAEFTRQEAPGRIRFRGSIDRIDTDGAGHAAIIDYKSSATGLSQWAKWIVNDELQLLLYALAFEKGLTKQAPQTVVSAVYYVARTLDRDKGYKVQDIEQGLYETADRKHNKISLAASEQLLEEAQAIVRSVLERMQTGDFAPIPKDTKTCRTCQWSAVCRAPHLNT